MGEVDTNVSQRALQIALQTMQERCVQLENRLAIVEKENIQLKVQNKSEYPMSMICQEETYEETTSHTFQKKIEELVKQKSQLTYHVLMVAAENRQLWNRLTRLKRTNKNLVSKLMEISGVSQIDIDNCTIESEEVDPNDSIGNDVIFQFDRKDTSFDEISLRLIKNIMKEKSELGQQYSEILELQNDSNLSSKMVGLTYPGGNNMDSLQHLKHYEAKLCQMKNLLLACRVKLQRALENLKISMSGNKKVCQIGTQLDSDDSLKEQEQSSLLTSKINPALEEQSRVAKNISKTLQTCPICSNTFGDSTSFHLFHEHVCSHFTLEGSNEFGIFL